ncbi:PadR family transcriptional regulator [Tenggerimyces flavus]|uniref:PadR family transcriptional regulator n=1 Tax=Tenggerimyces flavus TaxID=1708749 RepID=A0ABV7YH36_9ACTN|nr:PadR family transcriptional regulator [Tenggerimyces flavus]MBM7783972.1 DNA-binding PadR family transcriptional regulator [Tenggerimyces flavus]
MGRRPVGNLLALGILATLVEKPMHPYELASVLRERDKEQDLAIKWGSLYRVIQNLERYGFIEAIESGRQGARPERTVYRITAPGREEADSWVRELLAWPTPEHSRLEAGLSVMGLLGPDEMIALLQQRVERLESLQAAQRATFSLHSRTLPRLFLLEREYDLAVRETELAWTRSLLGELVDGSFPDLEGWRDHHLSNGASS